MMTAGIGAVLYLFFGERNKADILLKSYLGICFLWIGIMFFMVLGTGFPSPLKYIQGGLFVIAGGLFIVDIFTEQTRFSIPENRFKRNMMIFALLLVELYPLAGLLMGRGTGELIYPGTLPCATTAFALVLMSGELSKINKVTYVLLLVWAIPFAPLIQIPVYHVYEDSIMFAVGIYALIMLIISIIEERKKINLKKYKDLFNLKTEAVFATSSDGIPNIVPVHSKHLVSREKILISDQFMNKTKKNVIKNPRAQLVIEKDDNLYKISGDCQYKTSGFLYYMAVRGAKNYAKKQAKNKNTEIKCKGIVLMTVDHVEVAAI
jgi:hypothetical protein